MKLKYSEIHGTKVKRGLQKTEAGLVENLLEKIEALQKRLNAVKLKLFENPFERAYSYNDRFNLLLDDVSDVKFAMTRLMVFKMRGRGTWIPQPK